MESFASKEEVNWMMKRMDDLLEEFDGSTSSVFSTKNQVFVSLFTFFFCIWVFVSFDPQQITMIWMVKWFDWILFSTSAGCLPHWLVIKEYTLQLGYQSINIFYFSILQVKNSDDHFYNSAENISFFFEGKWNWPQFNFLNEGYNYILCVFFLLL